MNYNSNSNGPGAALVGIIVVGVVFFLMLSAFGTGAGGQFSDAGMNIITNLLNVVMGMMGA